MSSDDVAHLTVCGAGKSLEDINSGVRSGGPPDFSRRRRKRQIVEDDSELSEFG